MLCMRPARELYSLAYEIYYFVNTLEKSFVYDVNLVFISVLEIDTAPFTAPYVVAKLEK
jgi:hypothetical protein